MGLESDLGGRDRGGAAVVALDPADRDHPRRALRHGVGEQKLELAHLGWLGGLVGLVREWVWVLRINYL